MPDPSLRAGLEHELKCWPEYFAALLDGTKTFEYRLDDRRFAVGDTLRLREYDALTGHYSGRELLRRVTYLLRIGSEGYVVMAVADLLRAQPPDLLHEHCHDLVCNGGRAYPRGEKGHGCSCNARALRELEAGRAQPPPAPDPRDGFDLEAHLKRQRDFSYRTFGPGTRTRGIIAHILKELREIEAQPDDVSEWIDVVLLALDGAWRAGYTPQGIISALAAKQAKNEARAWPDWRTMSFDQPIEHVAASRPAPAPDSGID